MAYPRWCHWRVFAQLASGFGLMTEVDWSTLFKSFYETVRVKVACKYFRKIPTKRLYEMNKKLHLVYFSVDAEQEKMQQDQGNDGDDGGDDDLGDDGGRKMTLDDIPIDEQPPHTQGSSTSNNSRISKPSGNTGHKIVAIDGLLIDHLDQEKCLREIVEGGIQLIESTGSKMMEDVVVSGRHESKLVFESQEKDSRLLTLELTSRLGNSIREHEEQADPKGSGYVFPIGGIYTPTAHWCLLPSVYHLSEIENSVLSRHLMPVSQWIPLLIKVYN